MNNFTRALQFRVPQDFEGDFSVLLQEINSGNEGLLGIQAVHGGKFVHLCVQTTQQAQLAEARGLNLGDTHHDLLSLGQRYTFVSCFVPIEFQDMKLILLTKPYGDVIKVRRLKHKASGFENLENGCQVLTFSKLRKPLPTRLSFEGISIGFKYTGQPKSCLRCSSFEHVVAECPLKRTNASNSNDNSITPETAVNSSDSKDSSSSTETLETPEASTVNANPPTDSTPNQDMETEQTDQRTRPPKRPPSTPTKTEQGTKSIKIDNFEDFVRDLRNKADSPQLLQVSKDKVTKARALCLQRDHGNLTAKTLNCQTEKPF